jgi:hypothetical protein
MAYSGRFSCKNPKKYRGDPTKIYYRSLWERRFMVYCDNNDAILEWASEEFFIPYRSPVDNKVHRYFPDFFIKYKKKDGSIGSDVIEVKPKAQTKPPNARSRRTRTYLREVSRYLVNEAKFKAAEEFCLNRKYGFRILTEDDLLVK